MHVVWQATQCSTYKVSAVKCGVHLQFTNQDFKNIRMPPTASKDEGIATILQEDRKDRRVGREGRGGERGKGEYGEAESIETGGGENSGTEILELNILIFQVNKAMSLTEPLYMLNSLHCSFSMLNSTTICKQYKIQSHGYSRYLHCPPGVQEMDILGICANVSATSKDTLHSSLLWPASTPV